MQLKLKSPTEVRLFTLVITLVMIMGNTVLLFLFLPHDMAHYMVVPGLLTTTILLAPISYFVGTKLMDVQKLTQQLEHTADHDLLTGVSTRLSLYKRLDTCKNMPVAVIVVDIDHFKSINDTYGHYTGDVALRHFTSTLVRNCREDDIVARFGGEEFVILLRNTTLEDGEKAANRLCHRVREKLLVIEGEQVQITASFGVDHLNNISEVDDAINRADIAVYRAKEQGRNRVCVYDPQYDLKQIACTAAE